MKKFSFTITCLVVLGLIGCQTNQNAVHNQYQQATNAETAAWEQAQPIAEEKCGKYDDSNPMPPEKAVDHLDCWADIIRSIVMPYAMSPHLLNDYIIAQKKNSLAYKKGEIDRDEAKINAEENWNNYWTKLTVQYQQSMGHAYQADVAAAQARQQALQNMNQQMIQQQAIQKQNLRNTNCSTWNNQINCTSW